jgi:hypothetical protein
MVLGGVDDNPREKNRWLTQSQDHIHSRSKKSDLFHGGHEMQSEGMFDRLLDRRFCERPRQAPPLGPAALPLSFSSSLSSYSSPTYWLVIDRGL